MSPSTSASNLGQGRNPRRSPSGQLPVTSASITRCVLSSIAAFAALAGCQQTPEPPRLNDAKLVAVAEVVLEDETAMQPGADRQKGTHAGNSNNFSHIPAGALVQEAGRFPRVWKLDAENQADQQEVEIDRLSGSRARVSGLMPCDLVVVDPTFDLRDGDALVVTNDYKRRLGGCREAARTART